MAPRSRRADRSGQRRRCSRSKRRIRRSFPGLLMQDRWCSKKPRCPIPPLLQWGLRARSHTRALPPRTHRSAGPMDIPYRESCRTPSTDTARRSSPRRTSKCPRTGTLGRWCIRARRAQPRSNRPNDSRDDGNTTGPLACSLSRLASGEDVGRGGHGNEAGKRFETVQPLPHMGIGFETDFALRRHPDVAVAGDVGDRRTRTHQPVLA